MDYGSPESWARRSGRPRAERRSSRRILFFSAVLALLLPILPAAAQEAGSSKPQAVSGVVVHITPGQMTIQGDNGAGVTLTTAQDYTEVVAFGSHVTATYEDVGGRDVLQSLTPPLEASFVEPTEIRGYIHDVILLPESNRAGADKFYDELEDYLRSAFDWYVKPRVMAQEIQSNYAGSASALDLIDPKTGQFNMSRYLGSKSDLIRKVADETRVDAVIDASIDDATANLDAAHRVAKWDGYEESASEGGKGLSRLTFLPIRAAIPALTVSIGIWNAQGKPLWSRRMGFTVLMVQEGVLGKLRAYSLNEALENQDSVHQWFHLFFQPLLPAGEQPARAQRQ